MRRKCTLLGLPPVATITALVARMPMLGIAPTHHCMPAYIVIGFNNDHGRSRIDGGNGCRKPGGPSANNHDGSVSNVDIDRNNTLQVKAIGVAISTFETLP